MQIKSFIVPKFLLLDNLSADSLIYFLHFMKLVIACISVSMNAVGKEILIFKFLGGREEKQTNQT